MKRIFPVAIASALIMCTLKSQTIKSPDEFLGYEPGTQFTYHHKAVEYFKYIADNSPLAEYREYDGNQLPELMLSNRRSVFESV